MDLVIHNGTRNSKTSDRTPVIKKISDKKN